MQDTCELVPSISVGQLLKEREMVVGHVRTAASALSAASRLWRPDMSPFQIALGGRDYVFRRFSLMDEVALVVRRIDACYWERLISQSGLRSSLSASARALWKTKIDTADVMEFTLENVRDTFETYVAHREELLDEAILELFQGLSWNYASNLPQCFGKKIILTHFLGYGGGYPSLDTVNKIDDLNRAFHVMDGKPYPDHRNSAHQHFMRHFVSGKSGQCEFPYFTLQWFKTSRAAHVLPSSPELVAKLNRRLSRAAPNALPAPR